MSAILIIPIHCAYPIYLLNAKFLPEQEKERIPFLSIKANFFLILYLEQKQM